MGRRPFRPASLFPPLFLSFGSVIPSPHPLFLSTSLVFFKTHFLLPFDPCLGFFEEAVEGQNVETIAAIFKRSDYGMI
jgi:hypothetical protein